MNAVCCCVCDHLFVTNYPLADKFRFARLNRFKRIGWRGQEAILMLGFQPSASSFIVYLGLRPRLLCCRAYGAWCLGCSCQLAVLRLGCNEGRKARRHTSLGRRPRYVFASAVDGCTPDI